MPAVGKILIGAMSGTSADGVDAAAVSISGRGTAMTANLLQFVHVDYPPTLKNEIFTARAASAVRWSQVAELTRQITEAYVQAVEQLDPAHRAAAAAIAAHGQTFFHEPPDTLQLFDPALLAARTGLAVVSDFRRADCAAGGQGAPLVPFADYILFRHAQRNRVLLNIGGISNLTWLRAGGSIDNVIAFDTGPGNCVSDWLCREHDPAGPGFDAGGAIALSGHVDEAVCAAALRDAYVLQPPPKSTDTAAMLALFQRAGGTMSLSRADQLATACAVTARSIAAALSGPFAPVRGGEGQGEGSDALSKPDVAGIQNRTTPSPQPSPPRTGARGPDSVSNVRLAEQSLAAQALPVEMLASGGGVLNVRLMNELRAALPVDVTLSVLPDEMAQAKEAVAFALLGAATLDGEPSNVPSVTGATRRVILGSITPKP